MNTIKECLRTVYHVLTGKLYGFVREIVQDKVKESETMSATALQEHKQQAHDRMGVLHDQINVLQTQLSELANRTVDTDNSLYSLVRRSILRSEALYKPEREPNDMALDLGQFSSDYSLGYSCNLLNNAYVFCKIARKSGLDARLFLDPDFADQQVTARPHWEENEFQGAAMPETLEELPDWQLPDFVQTAHWDLEQGADISPGFEYEKLQALFQSTAVQVLRGDEYSYMLAYSVRPHRDLLALYNTVDVLHVSGTHIGLASFTDKPYVTFSFGGDLFVTPFEDSEIGWMQARGYRKANQHIIWSKFLLPYMERFGIPRNKINIIPFMIDTDVYRPMENNPLRRSLQERYAGKVIFFVGARQNWYWKGSDKLLRAIAAVSKKTDEAVFLTSWYGQDLARSEQLVAELGIENRIEKVGVLSKPVMRSYIDAADVCIDQFNVGALGTLGLEIMSCGKPLVAHIDKDKFFDTAEPAPILTAFSEEEIAEVLLDCIERKSTLKDLGLEHREWVQKYQSHTALWPRYEEVYKKALMEHRYAK